MEKLIYDILAVLIICSAVGIFIRYIYNKFLPKKKHGCDSGCGGCSTPCELKNMIKHQEN